MSPSDGIGGAPPEPTWTVTELHDALDGLLAHAFGEEIWVEGELRNFTRSPKQHVYFDLVDPEARSSTPAMLSVTLFDRERQAVNRHLQQQGGTVRMGDGVRVRVRGRLTTYAARSTLQLRMTWIDPTFTLGAMDLARDRVLATLAAEQLLDTNARTHLDPVPLRVALVTSAGSAAHADALDELRRSALGLHVTLVDARVQGIDAEASLVAALRTASRLPVDVVLLTRGGGARTDLASFDTEPVARAIASSPVPVFTGIGHEIDRTVADEVAHTAHKTPTACAAAVVSMVRAAAEHAELSWTRVAVASQGRLEQGGRRLADTGSRAGRAARHHLERDRRRVDERWRRIAVAAPRATGRAAADLESTTRHVRSASRHTLELAAGRLDAVAARARAHDPQLALARGWSITRDAQGRVVRDVAELRAGDELSTLLAGGTVRSVVADVDPVAPTSEGADE